MPVQSRPAARTFHAVTPPVAATDCIDAGTATRSCHDRPPNLARTRHGAARRGRARARRPAAPRERHHPAAGRAGRLPHLGRRRRSRSSAPTSSSTAPRIPISGRTARELADAVGVDAGAPHDALRRRQRASARTTSSSWTDAAAGAAHRRATRVGDAALRLLAPDVEPVLWPEHFDVAHPGRRRELRRLARRRASSPSRTPTSASTPVPADDPFWNAPFGAARPVSGVRRRRRRCATSSPTPGNAFARSSSLELSSRRVTPMLRGRCRVQTSSPRFPRGGRRPCPGRRGRRPAR